VDAEILSNAAEVSARELRALDAIHIATALSLGDDLGATANGLATLAPGKPDELAPTGTRKIFRKYSPERV
jgi:hypothetical protein